MIAGRVERWGNALLSLAAGIASFLFSLWALLLLTSFNEKLVAAFAAGAFCLLVCWIATERPNSGHARAMAALTKRLLAVEEGDFGTSTPAIVHREMPPLGQAVDTLFAQVRASIANAHALSLYDPVTSLPNRIHFRRETERLLSDQTSETSSAMIFIDLDRFKEVNDRLGHARGDETLLMVANRLRGVALAEERDGLAPLVARLAGDEFTLFLPRVADEEDAARVARRLLFALSEPFELCGQTVDVGASVGVALCPRDGSDLTSLMKASDTAMYQAKAGGRGQICVWSDALARDAARRTTTEAELRRALASGEFALVFQPQFAFDGMPDTVEALIRWNHPDGLRLPPSFISIAEDCGLIADIGDWVVGTAARALARWDGRGQLTRLAINVSQYQLSGQGFFLRLRETMRQAGAPLARLELEFTEDAVMQFNAGALAEIAALRADGSTVAIDDFGTGYSNLARLKRMPIDCIKLDKTLVDDIAVSADARTLAQAVVQIIQGVGCRAVGEGVETASQAEVLRIIGCDALQGFHLCRPVEEGQLFERLAALQPASQPGRGSAKAMNLR